MINILPVQGSIFQNLCIYNKIIDKDKDKGALEEGPTYLNATGPSLGNDTYNVSEAYASLNAAFRTQTEDKNIVKSLREAVGTTENPLPFPATLN